ADDAESGDRDQDFLVLEEEGEELAERGARTIVLRTAPASACCRRAGHEDLVLEGGVAGMSLLSAELLMRRLLGYAQGTGDRLPGVSRQARAPHLRLLGAGDLSTDAGEPVQLGERLAVGVCGVGGTDHAVNIR